MEYITARKLPLQDKINVRTKKAGEKKEKGRETPSYIEIGGDLLPPASHGRR